MKKTPYILALLAGTSALLLSGCAKEMAISSDGASLNFSANSLEIVSTKAAGEVLTGTDAATNRTMNLYSDGKLSDMTLEVEESVNTDGFGAATKAAEITELTTFTVAGFDGTTGAKWFPQSAASQEVTPESTYDAYKWKTGKSYNFFGYSNLPASSSVASAAIAYNGVTLTYTAVPESATDQKDILLGASYSNDPSKGEAKMRFFHPLAEVVFKLESSSFGGTSVKVTGITLDGVYKSGTVVCGGDENPYEEEDYFNFTWNDTSSKGTVSQTQTDASGITISSGVIGVPFMLIPQEFNSSAPLTVIVDLEIDGAAKSFTATLDDITWNSGKKYTYTIKRKSGPDPEFWVDLGMVSMDGHRLVVSKKNVKNIVNGVATFCDSDEDIRVTGGVRDLLVPTSLKSEDGRTCRPMSLGEGLSLLCPDVFSHSESSGTFIFTSRITGNQIKFPGLSVKRYYAVHDGTYYEIDYGLYSKLSVFWSGFETISGTSEQVKLVSELDNGETIAKTDFDFYGSSSTSFLAQYPLTNNYQENTISCISSQELHGYNYITDTNIFLCVYFENGYRNFGGSEFVVPDWLDLSLTSKDGSACTNYYLDGTCIKHVDSKEDSPAAKMVGSANFTSTGVITKYTIWQGLSSCFLKGTLITLADGSKKPVEEVTYDDELKVWNFDKGCYDSAKPFWITKAGQTTEQYYRMTFSDGTVLNILGPQYKSGHKLYNYTDRKFEGVKTLEVGKEVYTENGVVTLVSKEEVNEEVEFYCLMTENHLNCFAEGVLASLRYNNIYPFDENMKFIKDGRSRRPYKEFKVVGISREWYNGLRLGEQTDDLDTIKKYVDRYYAQTREKPAPTFWQKFRTWWKSIFG